MAFEELINYREFESGPPPPPLRGPGKLEHVTREFYLGINIADKNVNSGKKERGRERETKERPDANF